MNEIKNVDAFALMQAIALAQEDRIKEEKEPDIKIPLWKGEYGVELSIVADLKKKGGEKGI